MELRQLRYFIEVSRHNSFSQAAEACFITLQGISMSIIRLEDELGCKLFERSAKGVFLTKEGEYLLPRAQQIVRLSDECEKHFAEECTEKREVSVMYSLGLGRSFGAIVYCIGNQLARFQKERPDVHINVIEGQDFQCESAVENGSVDFALCGGPISRKMDARLLFEDQLVLNVKADHPLAERRTIRMQEIRDLPLVMQSSTTKWSTMIERLCAEAGFSPKIASCVDDVGLAMNMVENDQGACISTRASANLFGSANVRAIPLENGSVHAQVFLIKRRNAELSPEAAALEKLLLDCQKEFNLQK